MNVLNFDRSVGGGQKIFEANAPCGTPLAPIARIEFQNTIFFLGKEGVLPGLMQPLGANDTPEHIVQALQCR